MCVPNLDVFIKAIKSLNFIIIIKFFNFKSFEREKQSLSELF